MARLSPTTSSRFTGQTLLLVLSALATSGQGRGTILAAAKAIALVARLDDWMGRADGPLDRIAETLLRRIRFDRRDPVVEIPRRRSSATRAQCCSSPRRGSICSMPPLRIMPGIDYGCVVAGVPKPREEFKLKALHGSGVSSPCARCSGCCMRSPRAPHPHYPYPKPGKATQRMLDRGLGFKATPADQRRHRSDAEPDVRPAAACRARRSPRRGRALHAGTRKPADWLPSGAGFTPEAFEATWEAVAAEIARGRRGARSAGGD